MGKEVNVEKNKVKKDGKSKKDGAAKKKADPKRIIIKTLNIIVDVLVVFILIISVLILTMVLTSKGEGGVPNVFGKAPISVLSHSMEGDKPDDFNKGDLLLCDVVDKSAQTKFKVGDIVTFKLKGVDLNDDGEDDYVTHRIYKVKDGNVYQTKGDNELTNKTYDQDPKGNAWQDVTIADIVAVYNGTKISGLGEFIRILQTGEGFFFIILLPMIIFFLYQAIRVIINIIAFSKEKTLKKAQAMINNADLTEEQKKKAIEEYLAQKAKKEGEAPDAQAEQEAEPQKEAGEEPAQLNDEAK